MKNPKWTDELRNFVSQPDCLGVLPYFYVRSRARNDEVNIIIF